MNRIPVMVMVGALSLTARAASPWPAETNTLATVLTGIDSGLNVANWSGASWNPGTRTLWLACNSGYFWALVEDGAGSFRVATNAAGTKAKWTSGGDMESICQVDYAGSTVFLMDEDGWIREYNATNYGVVSQLRNWDIRGPCPEVGGAGSEGLAFVPDEYLQDQGFCDTNGNLYVSTNGMDGLMFVGHQSGGYVHVFDLNPAGTQFGYVGKYKTGQSETAGLEFDRSTGKLYIWHNTGANYLEVTRLTSYMDGSERRFQQLAEYIGPRAGNLEGFALLPTTETNNWCFITDDDNLGGEALVWYRQFNPPEDTTPPALAFSVPTNGAVCRTSRSNLWISGTAADAGGVTSVAWSVTGATVASGRAATGLVALIAPGATWKYLDNGTDQGTAWRATGFDDSAWASGTAEFGYGDGDEATTNSYGPDPNNKYVTTYYRRAFEVGDPRVFTNALLVAAVRDDGILAFLNGVEALRNYMPAGDIAYTTLAGSTAAGSDETNWQAGTVSAGALTQGLNVVAAEVHQVNLTSSDISFNLALGANLGSSWLITNAVLASGTSVVSVVARDASGNASTGTLTVVVTDDVDDDALPDEWEIAHFGDTATSSGGTGDEDEDGFIDWAEYVAGTDPMSETSFLAMEPAATAATGWVIRWPGGTNRCYDIYQSTNLFQPFTELATNLPAVLPLTSYTVPVSAAEGVYLRIRVRKP